MGKLRKITYSLKDVAVVQAPVSYTNHRSDVDPKIKICGRKSYPIFVAPMASVTDENNYKVWIKNGLTPVVPRSVQQRLSFEERMDIATKTFVSVSLAEAENELYQYLSKEPIAIYYICIDIAHGTLNRLYDICKKLKSEFGDRCVIMTGNIANPKAYSFYADANIDYVRVSVGTGSRCTSSCNVSVHYPMASLLDELNEERKAYAHSHNGNAPTKLIADGGISWFDDIQKALCLGADAVMCGNLIARAEEACGPIYYAESLEDFMEGNYSTEMWSTFIHPFREYFGMSCKCAQVITGGDGSRTAEGISRPVPVEYPIAKWVDNMQSYLRSCMTYTNSHTIKEMQENAQVVILGGSGDASYRK